MQLQDLPKTTTKGLRRVGRGHGSGRVKTSGRGTKGQKARRDIKLSFEGGALPLIKRMPFLKGRGKNPAVYVKPVVLNLSDLKNVSAKSVVDVAYLVKEKLVLESDVLGRGVKVLGNGEVSVALTVQVPVSKSAQVKIEKAGGSVSV